MKLKPILMAVAVLASLPALAQSQLTVVNFGGANGAAQKKAYVEGFEKATGSKVVVVEYNGEQAKIKAMVEAKKVTWDVVEVESPDVNRGCDEGLFEKIDWSKVGNKADFQPAAVHECGVGAFIWSTVMAYDGDKLKTAPTTWADFWDTKKFPGKRGMRKGARYNLEFALMADGVKSADVYKVLGTKEGAERAFKKLTELNFYAPVSELERHCYQLETYFREHAPATLNEAAAKIEELTGLKRSPSAVGRFLNALGMAPRRVGTIPSKADPEKQESFRVNELEPRLEQARQGKRAIFLSMLLTSCWAPFSGFCGHSPVSL